MCVCVGLCERASVFSHLQHGRFLEESLESGLVKKLETLQQKELIGVCVLKLI